MSQWRCCLKRAHFHSSGWHESNDQICWVWRKIEFGRFPRSIDGARSILNKGCRSFSQSLEENSRMKPRLVCDCFLASSENFVAYKSPINSYRCRFWPVPHGGSCHGSSRWLWAFNVIIMSCSWTRGHNLCIPIRCVSQAS